MIMDTVKMCNQTFYNTYINLKDGQSKALRNSLAKYINIIFILGLLKMFDYIDQGISVYTV